VASGPSGAVIPIRTATNKALPRIKIGGSPVDVAITPDGRTAYVASFLKNTVTPIRTATNKALAPITTGGFQPVAIVITP